MPTHPVAHLISSSPLARYVLERSFASAHPLDGEELLESLLAQYKRSSRQWCSTLNKLADVRMRGRKRSMVG